MKLIISMMALFTITNVFAANLDVREPLVLNWINGLPPITVLHGDPECGQIIFSNDSDGIIKLSLGNTISQSWLGIDGDVRISSDSLYQNYIGGGIDISKFHIQLQLSKNNNQLTSVQYRYFRVNGVVFSKEQLIKSINCSQN